MRYSGFANEHLVQDVLVLFLKGATYLDTPETRFYWQGGTWQDSTLIAERQGRFIPMPKCRSFWPQMVSFGRTCGYLSHAVWREHR